MNRVITKLRKTYRTMSEREQQELLSFARDHRTYQLVDQHVNHWVAVQICETFDNYKLLLKEIEERFQWYHLFKQRKDWEDSFLIAYGMPSWKEILEGLRYHSDQAPINFGIENLVSEETQVNECVICCKYKSNVSFQCGHVCCHLCARILEVCHKCRIKITVKHPLYLE